MKDVKDGKICDNASSYLNRIIKRTTKLHTKFNRGKMLQQVKSVANHNAYAEDVKFTVLSRTCVTRFSTSQYSEFLKLTESLPLYIDTFRKYGFNQDDEYEVTGKKFVVDLLALTDLMHPMIDLLVTLQGLSIPSWKICLWWPKVKRRIQKCIPISFESPDLPLKSTHIRDIRKGKFKGTKVVPGWLKVEKNVSEDASDGKKTTTIKWRARDLKDCRLDLEVFCGAMIKSMDDRFSGKSVKPCRSNSQRLTLTSWFHCVVVIKMGHQSSQISQLKALKPFKSLKCLLHEFWKEFNLISSDICNSGALTVITYTNIFLLNSGSGKIALTVVNEDKVYESIYRNDTIYSLTGQRGVLLWTSHLVKEVLRLSGKCVFRYGITESTGTNFK